MFLPLLRQPEENAIQLFLEIQRSDSFNRLPVGLNQQSDPAGYQVDHNRIEIGKGRDTFERACDAVRNWQMFNLGWVQIYPENAPIAEGTNVAILAHVFGFWFLNACRIVYTVNDREGDDRVGDLWRFGFAYGTLPAHLERGEERFLIEWNRQDDSVTYDILAYSQPNALIAKVGYPVVRHFQKRFARDSKQAMVKAVSN